MRQAPAGALGSTARRIAAVALAVAFEVAGCETSAPSPSRGPATPSAAPSVATPEETPTPAEAAAIRFRREFGLPSSLAHVRAVGRAPNATDDYGVPLLPEEVDEIEGRSVAAEEAVLLIEEYGAEHPGDFGGVYLDHAAGGQIVALFTGGLDRHAVGVWDAVWPEVARLPIRFKRVAHSQQELVELQEKIAADTEEWAVAGVEITSILVDIVGNQVEVGAAGPSAEAEAALAERYGAGWIRVAGGP